MITKNDIWRLFGIILLVGGQFMAKEKFEGFGVVLESNLVQIVGAALLLMPFIFRGVAAYKSKKDNQDTPQT